jgi:hypothetical protein
VEYYFPIYQNIQEYEQIKIPFASLNAIVVLLRVVEIYSTQGRFVQSNNSNIHLI